MEFISGNDFKNNCDFYLDEYGFGQINKENQREIPLYFVKTDYIHKFFEDYKPKKEFILVTHNSDIHITSEYEKYLNYDNLIEWYGQNVELHHPKLKSIPIGIANEKWEHGNKSIVKKIVTEDNHKTNLIYVNFSVDTNRNERSHCLNIINRVGLKMSQKVDFETYMRDLSKSFFVISPNGNGVDCHKIWEALYVKTIPIVTNSINANFYKNLPIITLNNWTDFKLELFTEDYYNKIWGDFDPKNLNIKRFVKYV